MASNPLISARARTAAAEPDPMLQHAQAWAHMHAQPPDVLQQHITTLDYGLPVMGALAGNPNVKAKDVIKAVSSAVAEGKLQPSIAVATISEMPADPDKLRAWLREKYAINLSAAVHGKAALLRQQQAGAAPAPVAGQDGATAAPGGATPAPAGATP